MALTVLGLSGDLSQVPFAVLYIDGEQIAAAEKERFAGVGSPRALGGCLIAEYHPQPPRLADCRAEQFLRFGPEVPNLEDSLVIEKRVDGHEA